MGMRIPVLLLQGLSALLFGVCMAVPSAASPPSRAPQQAAASAPAPAAPDEKVRLELDRDTLPVIPPAIEASGHVNIIAGPAGLENVALRIQAGGSGNAAPRIAWGPARVESHNFRLAALCHGATTCVVPFTVLHVATPSAQDLRLEAHDIQDDTLLGAADLHVVGEKPAPRAELTGDGISTGDSAIVLSLLRTRKFTFHLKNQSSAETIIPSFSVSPPDCPAQPGQPPGSIMDFSPADKWLQPGGETTVYATVNPCVDTRMDQLTLRITDTNEAGAAIFTRPLIIDPAWPFARFVRALPSAPVYYVLLGALASIVLNNFFPFQRSRRALQQMLVHTEATLNDCSNLATGLADALAAQLASCRAALNAVSWIWPSKNRLITEIQATITDLDATLKLAGKLDQHRTMLFSKEDYLSTESCTIIAGRLMDAEDALLAGDADTANIAMADAQKRFDAIFADTEQASLKSSLNKRLGDITTGLAGILAEQPPTDAAIHYIALQLEHSTLPPAAAANQAAGTGGQANANANPPPRTVPPDGTVDELLAIERNLFVIEIWLTLIEPRLLSRREHFKPFWDIIFKALLMAPKCAKTRMMLGLVRANTTPGDIAASLRHYGAHIDCPERPFYYMTNNFRAVLNDPLLSCIQTVRHFIDYTWQFDAERTARSRTFQCGYFFRPRPRLQEYRRSYVTVRLQVPFTSVSIDVERYIAARPVEGEWAYAASEAISFIIFTLGAVASAYVTKYGADPTGALSTMSVADMMTAILFGFSIDQLRDTVTNQASNRLAPSPSSGAKAEK